MVHVVVGEDQIFDRLAGILRLRGINHPLRLDLADRRVEDGEAVLHVHDQIIGPGYHLLDVGGELHHFGRRGRRIENRVSVEEAAESDPAQHPLIRNIIAGGRRLCCRLDAVGRRERTIRNRRIGGDVLVGGLRDLGTVEIISQRVRDLHAADHLPIAQHEVVIGIAGNVVVIYGADCRRQVCLGIKQNGEFVAIVGVGDRRQRLVAQLLIARGGDILLIFQYFEE